MKTSTYHDWENVGNPGSASLIGNSYCKIFARIIGFTHVAVDATADNEIQFAPDGFVSSDYIQMVNGGGDFREFEAGDSINILGSTSNDGTYTVLEKFDDSTIRIDSNLTSELSTPSTYVQAFRDHDSATFKYGLIENEQSAGFASNVDGSIQQWYLESGLLDRLRSRRGGIEQRNTCWKL